jgi:hypothetical protein
MQEATNYVGLRDSGLEQENLDFPQSGPTLGPRVVLSANAHEWAT